MLDKLNSFCSHTRIKIQIFIGGHHAFYRRPDTSNYFIELLEKGRFLYDNIENLSNKSHDYRRFAYGITNYI